MIIKLAGTALVGIYLMTSGVANVQKAGIIKKAGIIQNIKHKKAVKTNERKIEEMKKRREQQLLEAEIPEQIKDELEEILEDYQIYEEEYIADWSKMMANVVVLPVTIEDYEGAKESALENYELNPNLRISDRTIQYLRNQYSKETQKQINWWVKNGTRSERDLIVINYFLDENFRKQEMSGLSGLAKYLGQQGAKKAKMRGPKPTRKNIKQKQEPVDNDLSYLKLPEPEPFDI